MFRVNPIVLNIRHILFKRGIDYRAACLSLTAPQTAVRRVVPQIQERQTCPPPPVPPDPPKDNRLKMGALALAILTGYLTVYAKKSPEFRDWLTIHVPWFDDWIAIAYQENMTYEEFARCYLNKVKDYWTSEKARPRQCSSDGQQVPKTPDKPCDAPKGGDKPRVECKDGDKNKVEQGDKPPCELLPPPVVTRNLCELEACIKDQGEAAINNYMKARDACRSYNTLVVDTMNDFTVQKMKGLRPAMEERLEMLKEYVTAADDALLNLNELTRYVDCGMKATKEAIENTRALLKELQAKAKKMQIEYIWENDKSVVLDDSWQMVEELLLEYMKEIETMLPSVKFDAPKPTLADDPDLLLQHTLRYINKLRVILQEEADSKTSRVNRGLECEIVADARGDAGGAVVGSLAAPHRLAAVSDLLSTVQMRSIPHYFFSRLRNVLSKDENKKKANDALLAGLLKKAQADLDNMYKIRLDNLKKNSEQALKDALAKQKAHHEELLKKKLKEKEDMFGSNLDKMIFEAAEPERKKFAADLAEMAAKLKVVEDKLGERLKAEKEARRSQELWLAGSALLTATKKGGNLVKIDKELKALEKAAGTEDILVATVLKSIPQEVRTNGFVPESKLRERFHRMEDVARKVALVEKEGATMPIYIMSYVMSLLLFLKLSGMPQADIDKPIRERVDDLDTFDILQRARYWVDKGNIAAALRYISGLEGASRTAAETWHKEAKAHMEIRQAAEAVLAHAAALGLQYV